MKLDIYPVELAPLTATQHRAYESIKMSPLVSAAMLTAWFMSNKDNLERGFYIYQRYDEMPYPGLTVTGTWHNIPGLWGSFNKLPGGGVTHDLPVAYYHNHPGRYPNASSADNRDQDFGRRRKIITIIQTRGGWRVGY